jgi:ketosteroid isomerase-like protein
VTGTEVVEAYFDAVNGERWDVLATLWHTDGRLRAVGTRPREGRDDVLTYYHGLFDPWAEHFDQPTRTIAQDETVVVEVTFAGRTAAGRPITFDALDVFDLRDGQIVQLTSWYDLVLVRQLLSDA